MSKFQKCSKLFAKVSRSVLGWFFRKNFIQSVPWRVEFSKILKKYIFKIQKGQKLFPKVSKRVLNMFWGKFFGKFLPSFPWSVESSKIFKKTLKMSNFQKCSKLFPKVSKRVLNMFWGKFFGKFLPSFPWRVESSKFWEQSKKSQKSKNAQNRSQKCREMFSDDFFEKNLCTVYHGGSSFRKFSKKKYSKIQKGRKLFPRVSKCVLNMFRGIFLKSFSASVPWRLETSKIFEKNLKNVKIPKMFKIVRKSVQKCFGVIFSKKFYSECSMEGRVFENFKKIYIQKSKKAKNCSQKCPNVFWTCFGANFLENFCPVFRGVSSLPKFSKKL